MVASARARRYALAVPPVPQPRAGIVLEALGRPLPFSFFPVTRSKRRFGLYDAVFAVNPWSVMRGTVNNRLSSGEREESLAFLEQAEDFYRAATAGVSTNPLLIYYAFLNLAKALVRVRGYAGSLDRAMHGLSEQTAAGGTELTDSDVVVKDSNPGVCNVFPELVERLGYPRPTNGDAYPVPELLPQVVVGHRVWRESGTGHQERFLDLQVIEFVEDRAAKEVWLRFYVNRGDLKRYKITRDRLISQGGLNGVFREVAVKATGRGDSLVCLEQEQPTAYTGRATDVVKDLVDLSRPLLWRIVSTIPGGGYRRYYLHFTPPAETHRLPQLASLWALFYYFGSVVRYRPHMFDQLLAGGSGAFITEFISAQPEQMLYLLASELCQREIARPAIV